jgi:hypothetical protein
VAPVAAANDPTIDAPPAAPCADAPTDAAKDAPAPAVAATWPPLKPAAPKGGGIQQGGFKPGSSNLRVPFQ